MSHAKLGLFLRSLDNLLQKNVIVFFLEIKFQNGAHLKKGLFLTIFSHFLVTMEKLQKFRQHISHSHTCILRKRNLVLVNKDAYQREGLTK